MIPCVWTRLAIKRLIMNSSNVNERLPVFYFNGFRWPVDTRTQTCEHDDE